MFSKHSFKLMVVMAAVIAVCATTLLSYAFVRADDGSGAPPPVTPQPGDGGQEGVETPAVDGGGFPVAPVEKPTAPSESGAVSGEHPGSRVGVGTQAVVLGPIISFILREVAKGVLGYGVKVIMGIVIQVEPVVIWRSYTRQCPNRLWQREVTIFGVKYRVGSTWYTCVVQ